MKRIFALFAAIVLLVSAFVSCAEKEYNVDKAALAAALVEANCFSEQLVEVPMQMLKYSYQVADDVTAVLYRGNNTTAEELTVFEAPDAEAAKAVLDIANAYLDTLAKTYDQYNAKEAARIRDAIVVRYGKYVISCVCNDKAGAQKIIDEYFK